MAQVEVIRVLQKNCEWMSASDVAKELDWSVKKACEVLSVLLKYNEVIAKEINRKIAYKQYGAKRKMRLYKLSDSY